MSLAIGTTSLAFETGSTKAKDSNALSSNGDSFDAEMEKLKNEQARQDFLSLSKMNSVERIRAAYLKSKGLTEESLAALPAEERKKIEDEIAEEIRKKLKMEAERKGGLTSIG